MASCWLPSSRCSPFPRSVVSQTFTGASHCSSWAAAFRLYSPSRCSGSFKPIILRSSQLHRERRDVQELLPHLAVYLGHVGPENTYWYLSGTPELLHTASNRFESQHIKGGSNR